MISIVKGSGVCVCVVKWSRIKRLWKTSWKTTLYQSVWAKMSVNVNDNDISNSIQTNTYTQMQRKKHTHTQIVQTLAIATVAHHSLVQYSYSTLNDDTHTRTNSREMKKKTIPKKKLWLIKVQRSSLHTLLNHVMPYTEYSNQCTRHEPCVWERKSLDSC